MAAHPAPDLEETTTIGAPPEAVWRLVGDPRNYPRWSPMTSRTFVIGGRVAVGSRMFNLNRKGWRVWPTTAKVTDLEPGQLIAFRVVENGTTWSYDVEPDPRGTRLTLRRDASRGISRLSHALTRVALGGQETFTDDLRRGMRTTLGAVKAEAEA